MELKRYQKEVIADLKRFLEILCTTRNYKETYTQFWRIRASRLASAE